MPTGRISSSAQPALATASEIVGAAVATGRHADDEALALRFNRVTFGSPADSF